MPRSPWSLVNIAETALAAVMGHCNAPFLFTASKCFKNTTSRITNPFNAAHSMHISSYHTSTTYCTSGSSSYCCSSRIPVIIEAPWNSRRKRSLFSRRSFSSLSSSSGSQGMAARHRVSSSSSGSSEAVTRTVLGWSAAMLQSGVSPAGICAFASAR